MKVLILRPQPGAGESAARARALGLEPVVAPLFAIRRLDWRPPDPAGFDAVMLTSAQAPRLAGDGLTSFLGLPCYAVGARTAEAARSVGFANVTSASGDAADLLDVMAADGVRRAFHPCGREHRAAARADVEVEHVPVYAADAADALPAEAAAVLADGALVLLHSPRAASVFATLAGERGGIRIATISTAAAEAAGPGWEAVEVAPEPSDPALLELAAKLCQSGAR